MIQILPAKYYAGIGSRGTPLRTFSIMTKVASAFEDLGYILRSGGADGADSAFEMGVKGKGKEVWLPWKTFNDNPSQFYLPENLNDHNIIELAKVARQYHPAWDKLQIGAKRMMVRNVCQVLGYLMNSPVDFVVCWTKDGKDTGGTGQAIRIANDRGIPVFNLYNENEYSGLRNYYRELKNNAVFV